MEAELHINPHTTKVTCHTHMLYKNAMEGNIRQGPLNKWTEHFNQSFVNVKIVHTLNFYMLRKFNKDWLRLAISRTPLPSDAF